MPPPFFFSSLDNINLLLRNMGRAKLEMKLIEKEKSRMMTYKKRSEGLTKKLHQITTLCGIGACMIMTEPLNSAVEIWPPNDPDQVARLVDLYKSKTKEIGGVKNSGLSDYFENRQRKAQDEVAKLRSKNSEAKYPTWSHDLDAMNESQLRGLGAALRSKAHFVRSRIDFLKMREKQELEILKNMTMLNPSYNHFYAHQDIVDVAYFTQTNCSGNFAPLQRPMMTYDATVAQLGHHQYYASPMLPPLPLPPVVQMPQPYVRWPVSSSGAGALPPDMHCSSMENVSYWGDEDDYVTQYHLPFNKWDG